MHKINRILYKEINITKFNNCKKFKIFLLAACSKAETGVGASILPGNQLCKGIWADLAKLPPINNNEIIVIAISLEWGAKENIVS